MTAVCSVRLARPEDVPAISRLVEELDELHRAAHAHLFNPRAARDEGQTLAALRDSASALLVAEGGGEGQPARVGFLRIRDVTTPRNGAVAPRRFGLVDELMVDRARRREGVASELLSAAEGWARGRGSGTSTSPLRSSTAGRASRGYVGTCGKRSGRAFPVVCGDSRAR